MKVKIAALTVAVLLVVGAASDGIQRQEFAALQQQVAALERRMLVAEAHITLIQKKLAGHLAGKAPDVVDGAAAPAAQGVPLEGRDLDAWKLARQAAQQKHRDFSSAANSATVPLPDGRGGWVRVGLDAPLVTFDEGAPTTDYMEKDANGDYLFRFARRRESGALNQVFTVRVVDYGSELRADAVTVSIP